MPMFAVQADKKEKMQDQREGQGFMMDKQYTVSSVVCYVSWTFGS